MNTGQTIEKRDGMSVTTLVLGLVVLVLLLGAGGAGIGQVELAVWLALVVGWVALWWSKRRRPETIEKPVGMSVTTLILGLFVLVLLLGRRGILHRGSRAGRLVRPGRRLGGDVVAQAAASAQVIVMPPSTGRVWPVM